jgi:toxin ParE1/3/4
MARVLRTPLARRDLKGIGQYIARESGSRSIALRFLDRIAARAKTQAEQPKLGERRPDLGAEVRCFPVGNYVVFYRPIGRGIELLRVLHGARDVPSAWREQPRQE